MSDRPTSPSQFVQYAAEISSRGVGPALEMLAAALLEQKNFRDLFTVRQMQARHKLGLPVIDVGQTRDLVDPLRTQLEDAYVEACREVGLLLLAEGKLREAWMYLQISGDKAAVRERLASQEPTEANSSEMVEIALYEGVWPRRGLELILDSHGVCNTITTLDGMLPNLAREEQAEAASLLVGFLHGQLLENVRADIERQQGKPPAETTLATLLTDREWLLADGNYHTDTSHLSSVVRFARMSDDADTLRLAVDLTEYGRRLHKQFQFSSEEPFAEYYPAHGLFLGALLAQAEHSRNMDSAARADVIDDALVYFRQRAETANVEISGTAAAEFYISLLGRLRRFTLAMDELAHLIPPGTPTMGIAPHLWELAEQSGNYQKMADICRDRGDIVGYTGAMAAAALSAARQ
ncbi:MAG: hypothetical protein WD875_00430 [Pirellulales bacterium]